MKESKSLYTPRPIWTQASFRALKERMLLHINRYISSSSMVFIQSLFHSLEWSWHFFVCLFHHDDLFDLTCTYAPWYNRLLPTLCLHLMFMSLSAPSCLSARRSIITRSLLYLSRILSFFYSNVSEVSPSFTDAHSWSKIHFKNCAINCLSYPWHNSVPSLLPYTALFKSSKIIKRFMEVTFYQNSFRIISHWSVCCFILQTEADPNPVLDKQQTMGKPWGKQSFVLNGINQETGLTSRPSETFVTELTLFAVKILGLLLRWRRAWSACSWSWNCTNP